MQAGMEVVPMVPAQGQLQPTLWASIREAVRGSHQDYTTGSLNRAILLLAIPMVLEMVLESLFALVDVFWVSRLATFRRKNRFGGNRRTVEPARGVETVSGSGLDRY